MALRRTLTGLVLGLVALLGAPSALAAAPDFILVSGPGMARPILLSDWGENLDLLSSLVRAPRADARVVLALGERPRLELSEFWGWGQRPRPTRPSQANQRGWFYPAKDGNPAVFELMVDGTDAPRLAPGVALRILAHHGVSIRLGATRTCPVTVPRHRASGGFNYGTRDLRVELYWPRGTLTAGPLPGGGTMATIAPDGSIDVKVGWWRGLSYRLTIVGRRLDAPAPPLRADIPEGYGSRGFQPTGLIFPTTGCWRVTGRLGPARLTFVVRVTTTKS
jgi:hypothetical protein